MPCWASASGSCDSGMLLRWATSLRALFSASSGTLRPARVARCAWISCRTRRSSTCWRSTFCGGSSSFWARSRSLMAGHLVIELAVEHHPVVHHGGDAIEQSRPWWPARGSARMQVLVPAGKEAAGQGCAGQSRRARIRRIMVFLRSCARPREAARLEVALSAGVAADRLGQEESDADPTLARP